MSPSKIAHMPGTEASPELVLAQAFEQRAHILNVAVVIQWKDTRVTVDWSCMKYSEAAYLAKIFDMCVGDNIKLGRPRGDENGDG